jgi:hypothetical protein
MKRAIPHFLLLGLILPLLSVCKFASDGKKFPIEVESEYLPTWLILGEGIKSV